MVPEIDRELLNLETRDGILSVRTREVYSRGPFPSTFWPQVRQNSHLILGTFSIVEFETEPKLLFNSATGVWDSYQEISKDNTVINIIC